MRALPDDKEQLRIMYFGASGFSLVVMCKKRFYLFGLFLFLALFECIDVAGQDSADVARWVNGVLIEGQVGEATKEGLSIRLPQGVQVVPWKYLSAGTRLRYEQPMLLKLERARLNALKKAAAAEAAKAAAASNAAAKAAEDKKAKAKKPQPSSTESGSTNEASDGADSSGSSPEGT